MNTPTAQGPFMKAHSPGNKGFHFMVISMIQTKQQQNCRPSESQPFFYIPLLFLRMKKSLNQHSVKSMSFGSLPRSLSGKDSACQRRDTGRIPRSEHPLEKEGTNSSILAQRILWTEEPGSYSPWGCKELDTTQVTQHTCMHSLLGRRYTENLCTSHSNFAVVLKLL